MKTVHQGVWGAEPPGFAGGLGGAAPQFAGVQGAQPPGFAGCLGGAAPQFCRVFGGPPGPPILTKIFLDFFLFWHVFLKIIICYLVDKCQIWLDLAKIIINFSYSVDLKLISGRG